MTREQLLAKALADQKEAADALQAAYAALVNHESIADLRVACMTAQYATHRLQSMIQFREFAENAPII